MEVILRGVRGSIANPSPDTAFYGDNAVHADRAQSLLRDPPETRDGIWTATRK